MATTLATWTIDPLHCYGSFVRQLSGKTIRSAAGQGLAQGRSSAHRLPDRSRQLAREQRTSNPCIVDNALAVTWESRGNIGRGSASRNPRHCRREHTSYGTRVRAPNFRILFVLSLWRHGGSDAAEARLVSHRRVIV